MDPDKIDNNKFIHMVIRMEALALRSKPKEFLKFIEKNKEYFKEISDEDIENIRKCIH